MADDSDYTTILQQLLTADDPDYATILQHLHHLLAADDSDSDSDHRTILQQFLANPGFYGLALPDRRLDGGPN